MKILVDVGSFTCMVYLFVSDCAAGSYGGQCEYVCGHCHGLSCNSDDGSCGKIYVHIIACLQIRGCNCVTCEAWLRIGVVSKLSASLSLLSHFWFLINNF